MRWVKPQLVAEIEFAGWTDGGNVRQAAFKGLRSDKRPDEVLAEMPAPATTGDAQISLKAARSAPQATACHRRTRRAASRVKFERDGREYFTAGQSALPDGGDGKSVSKLDLGAILRPSAVGSPTFVGRPCSLVCGPDGIGGPRFFQRHAMRGTSGLIELVKVSGRPRAHVQLDRVAALAAVAQTAALELHPWNCAPFKPDVPGRLVFDLDPAPEVSFDAVINAALELRERLGALGLTTFSVRPPRKGLHVVTPLKVDTRQKIDWPLAKAFAQGVCMQMAADSPSRYLVTMAKKLRTGRIFLDYLRNDRMATAVVQHLQDAREGDRQCR